MKELSCLLYLFWNIHQKYRWKVRPLTYQSFLLKIWWNHSIPTIIIITIHPIQLEHKSQSENNKIIYIYIIVYDIYIYICGVWDAFSNFSFHMCLPMCHIWSPMSWWMCGHNIMIGSYIMTTHHNIMALTSLMTSFSTCIGSYNRPSAASWGDSWFISR